MDSYYTFDIFKLFLFQEHVVCTNFDIYGFISKPGHIL